MNMVTWMWLAWLAMAGGVGVYGWGWTRADEKGRNWLEWGLAALVAGVSLASVLTHEPWRDEIHAWLLARNWSVAELFVQMHYEGHFAFWHLLLHPFARLGAGMVCSGLISWIINLATVAWFARKAPFDGWAKASVGLSCVFLYVNPAISRCYVLVPPLLFGLAALWKKRDEKPIAFSVLTALLANTHLYLEGTAGLIVLVYAWENICRRRDGRSWRACRRQLIGLALMCLGIAIALAQMLPGLWDRGICFYAEHFGWSIDVQWFFQGCTSWIGLVGMMVGLAWLGVVAWRRDRGLFSVYAGSLAYMVLFSVYLYPAHVINRALLWWPIALGTAWGVENREKGWGKLSIAIALIGLGLMRPDLTWADWKGEYDPLPGTCRWVEERYGRDAEVWVNGGDLCAEVATAYLDNLWDWRTGERVDRLSMAEKAQKPEKMFCEFVAEYFEAHPDAETVLVLGSLSQWSGLTREDARQATVEVIHNRTTSRVPMVCGDSAPESETRKSIGGRGVLDAHGLGTIGQGRQDGSRGGMGAGVEE